MSDRSATGKRPGDPDGGRLGRVSACLLCTCLLASGARSASAQIAGPFDAPASIALWEPVYTSYLLLSETDDLITLEAHGDELWLATERVVSRFGDGVWTPPEIVADDAMVLALAPLGAEGDVVAFGFEGGIWMRRDGVWSAVASPTGADLYDAYGFGDHEAWAVGFDYDRSVGAVVSYDGFGFRAFSPPWLSRRQLLAIDASASGELWAGGCDGNDFPFLMRDGGAGEWVAVDAPAVSGCIEDIAFTSDGRGLAAADGDLLWFDGQTWIPFGQPAPEGTSWVRVALDHGSSAAGDPGTPPRGWAVPGTPTWRGYIDGADPWVLDEKGWRELEADYRGYDLLFRPSEALPGAQPFLDVASFSGGPIAVCRSVIQSEEPGQRRAGLMRLDVDAARLEHPLVLSLGRRSAYGIAALGMGDIATPNAASVWAGARLGAAPLLGHGSGMGWRLAPGGPSSRGRDFWVQLVDFASPGSGWAFGGLVDGTATTPVTWRQVLGTWIDVPTPPGSERYLVQLRSLPDGGAWALTTQSRLQVFDGAAWEQLPADAPVLGPAWAPDGQLQLISLRAPFDAVTGPLGTTLGWAASREHLYQILAGRFEAVQDLPRGQVLDLQLVDPRHGWAIAYQDPFLSGSRPPGVLLRLVDRRWSEIDLVSALRDNADAGQSGGAQPAADARTVRWWLMSAVSETEVWLYGGMAVPSRPGYLEPILVRFRADPRGGPARDVVVFGDCSVDALSAVAGPAGGTDVWLMSRSQCGPSVRKVPDNYAGPVSVLRVRDTTGSVLLPIAHNGGK